MTRPFCCIVPVSLCRPGASTLLPTRKQSRTAAVPVATGEEIIQAINPKLFNPLQRVQKKLSVELSEAEQKIMENLGSDPVHIDQLVN